jgi:hypothetical protein
MCGLVYDHISVRVFPFPAIKKLEQNQNGKLYLEINHNTHIALRIGRLIAPCLGSTLSFCIFG